MTKESRLLYISGLILFLYAGINYLQHGGFIFPIPLNEFIFFVVAAQFTVWHYKKGIPVIAMLLASIFGILSKKPIWEIFLSLDDLITFSKQPWIPWFMFLGAVCIVIAAVQLLLKQKRHFTAILTAVAILAFAAGFHFQNGLYTLIAYALISVSLIIRPENKPVHLIWHLLLMLETTTFISYNL